MDRDRASRRGRFRFADRAALLAKASELGVSLPFSDDLAPLFEPVKIGARRAPNRLVIHPMEGADAEPEGGPGELTFRRYDRFGAGGCALIWFEATAVAPEGRSNPRQLYLHEGTKKTFARLVEATRRAARSRGGAGEETLLILQLTHSGRFAKPRGTPQPCIAQEIPMLASRSAGGSAPRILSDQELDALQDRFAAAARLAAEVGFDGVDVKACHGYLASELLGARTREKSRYGGSFENRTRFLKEVLSRIAHETPSLLVTSRLGVYDGLPFPYGFGAAAGAGGAEEKATVPEDLTEPIALVRELSALGAPLLNLSLGIPHVTPHLGRPFDLPLKGGSPPGEHPLTGVARLVRLLGAVQAAAPDLPMVGTGFSWLRRFFPHVAAGAVREGKATLIGLGRTAFACPDFAHRLKRDRALKDEDLCIACSGCSNLLRAGGPAGCIVRDRERYKPKS